MIKIGEQPKKAILSVHLFFVIAWLGTVVCSLILLVFHTETSDTDQLSTVSNILSTFYFVLLIPSAIGTIKTGIILSIFTHWGLTKYYWVIVKWLVSASMIVWLTLFIGRSIHTASSTPIYNKDMIVLGFVVQIILLITLVVISVFKPWGKYRK